MVSQRVKTSRRMASLLVLAMVAGLLATTVPASAAGDPAGNDYLVVTLNGAPAAHDDASRTEGRFDPDSQGYARTLARLQRQHERFLADLAQVAPDAEVVQQYYVTANAVALKLNGADPAAVGRIRGVARTAESALYRLDMDQSVGLINADDFWTAGPGRADAGDGVVVGVIDSGIDQTHPFFWCKTVEFGGVYASGVGILPQIPAMPAIFGPGYVPGPGDPLYFSSDHGTHVAGTIGGCITELDDADSVFDGTVLSGVAPGATLRDYNVFPAFGAGFVAFGGSAFSHDIAAAIEDAIFDGVDVINMSLGGSVQGPHDFLAEVSNNAVTAGVVVVASAGNSGDDPYTVGSPGSASEVIGVGASTNTRGMGVIITIDPDGAATPTFDAVPGDFPDFDGTTMDLIDWPGSDNTACSTTGTGGAGSLSDEIVIISRGGCTFSQKVANAKLIGAGGAVIYNHLDGDAFGMGRSAGFDDELPAVMVTKVDGLALEGLAPDTASITAPFIMAATPNLLADFSSRGPVPFTHALKPDVVAPGVNILSSVMSFTFFVVTDHGWELFNGTSMSSPHVAGAAAALLGEHPGWTATQVKSAIVNTADTTLPGLDVWEQGGGLLDLVAADGAERFFYPSSASFGITTGNKPANGSVWIAISGGGGCDVDSVTGDFISAEVVSGTTLTVEFEGGRDAVSDFYQGYVTVDCGGAGTYTVPWLAIVDR